MMEYSNRFLTFFFVVDNDGVIVVLSPDVIHLVKKRKETEYSHAHKNFFYYYYYY